VSALDGGGARGIYKGKPSFELISFELCINFIIDNLIGDCNHNVKVAGFFAGLLHGFRIE
jgi:hypothetical protein